MNFKIQDHTMLINAQGVKIDAKTDGDHWCASNALCECGYVLFVAPPIFEPNHHKGDPVMVCEDHGIHGYRFSELQLGRQPYGSACGMSPTKI